MTRPLRWAVNSAAFVVGFSVVAFVLYLTGALDDSALPPCPTEDSTHCYWDASESGNGLGSDLVHP